MNNCKYCGKEIKTGDKVKIICVDCFSKIADLEAKLAEYEDIMKDYNIQDLTELDEFLAKYDFDEDEDGNIVSQVIVGDQKYIDIDYFATIYKENKQLKQQLAEKTLTIEQINKTFIENRSLWKGKYEQAHQDKISFAIEQLEKVKKKILSYEEIYYQFLESGAKIPVVCVENFRVRQYIDQQINELKGEKNGTND